MRFCSLRAGELHLEEGQLNEVVAEYVDFLEPQSAAADVEIRTHLDSDLPPVLLDRALMRQRWRICAAMLWRRCRRVDRSSC